MATANERSTLDGLFKEVYADNLENLIPSDVKFTKMVNFVPSAKEQGGTYNQPVIVAQEQGFTFSDDGSVYQLNGAVAGATKNATVSGYEIVLQSQLSYNSATRAANGRNAFIDATKLVVKNMKESFARMLEIELMYGGSGIATVASVSGNDIVISDAEWASGIWIGREGARIQAYDTVTGGTKQNTAGTYMTVTAIDIANKTITVDNAIGVAANDILFFHGSYDKEMKGLHSIMTNSGSLFGINAANYSVWSGNSYGAAGALSFQKISEAIDAGLPKGLDSDVTVLCNYKHWTALMNDEAAKRQYNNGSASGNAKVGHEALTFFSQNGTITFEPSAYVKEGYSYVLSPNKFVRIGSTDVTFNRPGHNDQFFMDLETAAGYELRAYTDQALFCEAPGKQIVITGVTA